MYNIKTFNAIAPVGLADFTHNYQINNEHTQPDGYIIRSVDLHHHQWPTSLKAIARAGAGFNNIPLASATNNGIAVFTTPGSNANAVKELVISMLIAASRNLFAATTYAANNSGADISLRTENDKTQFNGSELINKRLAVIGVGHVGSLVANAALSLGMQVIGYDPFLSADAAWQISTDVKRADSLTTALENADYVTVHVPKNEYTLNLIDADALTRLKDNTILLNFSRAGIVDNSAILTALNAKQLKLYLTDFGEEALLNRDDVIITPHLGGSTLEAEVNGARQAAHTLMTFLETGNVINSVNLPNMQVPFNSDYRLTIIHENIPNMVGQITTYLAQHNINIEGMANNARGAVAYTIIDINKTLLLPKDKILATLMAIPAIYRVRLLDNPK